MKKIIFLILFSLTISAQSDERFELKSILFEGNNNISSDELRSIIFSKESPGWFSQFLHSFTSFGGEAVYFDSLLIFNDIRQLENYYYDNGFFKVSFSHSYTLDTTNYTAELKYLIKENDPAYFRSINVTGLELIAWQIADEVKELTTVDTTKKYSASEVSRIRNQILRLSLDFGHMLISSEVPDIQVDTVNNKVDVHMDFVTGDRYRVSEVRINKTGPGADKVDDDLLRRIADIKPNDYYSFYNLQRAQIRLYRTNLFSSVLLSGIVSDTNKNYVPLALNADVGLMNELSPEIIINNEDNAFNLGVGLSFSRKNFLGDARKLTLSTSTAAQDITQLISNPSLSDTNIFGYADVRAILEQPYLLGRNINTKLEGYYTLQKRRNEYNATLYGGKISFDIALPRFTFLTSLVIGLSVEESEYIFTEDYTYDILYSYFRFNRPDFPPVIIDSLVTDLVSTSDDFTSQKTNTIISVDLGANKSNSLLYPTEGYTISLLMESGNSLSYLANKIAGKNFDAPLYIKGLLTTTAYFPIFSSSQDVLAAKFRIGAIQTYEGDQFEIPLNQKFYAGGSNSVRGWKTRELVPEQNIGTISSNPDPEEIEAVLLRNIIPGGFVIIEGSIEARNRIFERIGTSVFIDYGNVWNDFNSVQLNNFAVAAGFGIRYYSDFAPFRIDFGFKVYDPLDRRSFFKKGFFSETFEFHFGIGEAF
ncbi:MAG TPA: hypothetical protein ENN33_12955 [Ignavibacteria bacterium]|nr:hypothetical protein [Ignavibacteria bacterium]